MKFIASEWKGLSSEDRTKYEQMALEDRERWEKIKLESSV